MVEFKNKSVDSAFQKWFPLKIVDINDIPHPSRLLESTCLDASELAIITQYMITLCQNKKGVGLAAVQCGLPLKLFVAAVDGMNFRAFIDLEYTSDEDKQNSLESCLSINDSKGIPRRFIVKRYNKASFAGKELLYRENPPVIVDVHDVFTGLFSVICQHEIDHHNGKLIKDEGQEVEVIS